MSDQRKGRKILFASLLCASRTNALGVQMLHLAEPFGPAWADCYWYNDGRGKSEAPTSYRLYSSIPDLWPFATGRGFVSRMTGRLGLGWWRGNHLIARKKSHLRRLLDDIGFAFVGPLWNNDATRCREILQTIGCPFVVHIWDFLDKPLNADYQWLFSHAEQVFYLSPTMVQEIRATAQCETSLLSIARGHSQFKARHCGADMLKIGLVGTLSTYSDGVELLSRAIDKLHSQFAEIRIKYLGAREQLAIIPESLREFVEYAGYLYGDVRDKALADCNVAYLPGPLLSPQEDARSRHSIPSRLADYMAIGLPVIAAVHPSSATNAFFASIRSKGFFPASEPDDINCAVQELQNEMFWKNASDSCLGFFGKYFDKEQAQRQLLAFAEEYV